MGKGGGYWLRERENNTKSRKRLVRGGKITDKTDQHSKTKGVDVVVVDAAAKFLLVTQGKEE